MESTSIPINGTIVMAWIIVRRSRSLGVCVRVRNSTIGECMESTSIPINGTIVMAWRIVRRSRSLGVCVYVYVTAQLENEWSEKTYL